MSEGHFTLRNRFMNRKKLLPLNLAINTWHDDASIQKSSEASCGVEQSSFGQRVVWTAWVSARINQGNGRIPGSDSNVEKNLQDKRWQPRQWLASLEWSSCSTRAQIDGWKLCSGYWERRSILGTQQKLVWWFWCAISWRDWEVSPPVPFASLHECANCK